MKARSRLRKAFAGGLGLVGGAVLLAFLLAGLFPEWIARWDPLSIDTNRRLQPPSAAHPFGTDELGRDVFSRTVHGSRISLGSALVVVLVSGAAGTALGLQAGYYGGRAGEAMLRVADVFIAFPALIMAMGIVALLGPGLINAMLAIIVIWWPQYVRLANGQVRAEREKPYVEAARAVGRSDAGILWRHILPNCWVPVLIKGTLDVGVAILLTASLSFLGLGVKPPTPELGALVTQGRDHLLDAWWYSTFPGLAMFLAVFGFNLVGDSLRDALDPTLSQG
jgi:peptide/nickel transport system permease protein